MKESHIHISQHEISQAKYADLSSIFTCPQKIRANMTCRKTCGTSSWFWPLTNLKSPQKRVAMQKDAEDPLFCINCFPKETTGFPHLC